MKRVNFWLGDRSTTAALLIVGLGSLLATEVEAQDILFDISATRACLDAARTSSESRACIGTSAEECMEGSTGGYSTYGMGACISHEYEWWDARLNEVYRALMDQEKRDDQENRSLDIDVPAKADALLTMQRHWIKFRDSTCAYEYSQWGGGTGGGPASAGCAMRMTGEQTIYLQDVRLGY